MSFTGGKGKIRKIIGEKFVVSEKSSIFAPMNELQRHIEILLLNNDCVIVPGLGGFMAHHIEARFDEEDNAFVPPLRTLGFNQNLTMNDSLLVQSYIECYDISYPEALRRIESEVEELKQHLQAEGTYELNDIGVLTLNAEGNLEFQPCEAGILTPSLYGFGTFEMTPLVKTETATDDTHEEQAPAVEEPQGADDGDGTPDEPTIVIKMKWLRHAVAVAAAVATFFMIGTPVSNSNIDQQNTTQQSSIIPIAAQATTNTPDAETVGEEAEPTNGEAEGKTPEADTAGETAIQESASAESHIQESASAESPAAVVADAYCIVLASQVSQKNADTFVELLANNGFRQARITNRKFRRVVYGNYNSKEEAVSQLRQLRSQDKKLFGEGWVMKSDD